MGLPVCPRLVYGGRYSFNQILLSRLSIVLERYLGSEGSPSLDWESMGFGAPMIMGMAQLCSQAMAGPHYSADNLSIEGKAMLFLARERGILELRGTNDAFESCQRLLTVFIECEDDQFIALKAPGNVRQTVKFLEGFRQACQAGLLFHHLQREFSLSARGFDFADQLNESELETILEFAQRSESL